MIFYRLEVKDSNIKDVVNHLVGNVRQGPYRNNVVDRIVTRTLCKFEDDFIHPTPDRDYKLRSDPRFNEIEFYVSEWVFGFETLEEVYEWFNNIKTISNVNAHFVIGEYFVPDEYCIVGEKQCIAYESQVKLSRDVEIEINDNASTFI